MVLIWAAMVTECGCSFREIVMGIFVHEFQIAPYMAQSVNFFVSGLLTPLVSIIHYQFPRRGSRCNLPTS
jgi:hypothetical protein